MEKHSIPKAQQKFIVTLNEINPETNKYTHIYP